MCTGASKPETLKRKASRIFVARRLQLSMGLRYSSSLSPNLKRFISEVILSSPQGLGILSFEFRVRGLGFSVGPGVRIVSGALVYGFSKNGSPKNVCCAPLLREIEQLYERYFVVLLGP